MDRLQKIRQRHGAASEEVVRLRLVHLGFLLVEKVETPWRIVRGPGGRVVGAHPLRRVSGDFRAVRPGGQSVLVEVKWRDDGPLSWGDLEPHQQAALGLHRSAGGLSLVCWCCPSGLSMFEPSKAVAAGWRKGQPLQWTVARALSADWSVDRI
jgi:hypothetical protein